MSRKFMEALFLFRSRRYEESIALCTEILKETPLDKATWVLKMRALTLLVYVDDIEAEEEGIADSVLDNPAVATAPRPGTSLRNPGTAIPGQAFRPRTQSGRPLTGVIRPGTQSGTAENLEQALQTPRTSMSAKPITASSGLNIRLGTASMLSEPGGPFIQLSRLNIPKQAKDVTVAKPLFEYIYYHEHEPTIALDLAVNASNFKESKDWYWKVAMGKCYYVLGLTRDAEQQFRSALKDYKHIETLLRLVRIYIRLDQPLAALDTCKAGLEYFPKDVSILTEMARLYEGLNNSTLSIKYYKTIIQEDASDPEAIASIGMHYFYNDQPEVALRFYRRLLQMGVYNTELFNNLGLCCFYSQQFDHTVSCFERAINLATEETISDVWYNISHVAISIGDLEMADESLRLAINADNSHALAFNNLGVLEVKKGHLTAAATYFHAAANIGTFSYEPNFNSAHLAFETGDLQTSFNYVKKSLKAYPDHRDSKELLKKLKRYFAYI